MGKFDGEETNLEEMEGDVTPIEELMKPVKTGKDTLCYMTIVKPNSDVGPAIQVCGSNQDLGIGARIMVEYIVERCDVDANWIFEEIYAALADKIDYEINFDEEEEE